MNGLIYKKHKKKKTYAAYFMVLGTFYVDVEKLLNVNN